MPKLVKLETDANVSNYTPEAGNITTFFAEEDGAVKLKYKNSAGEIAELSGGGGGGGAFDLVKVTEYTPYQAAFSGVSAVTFSGFGVDEMSGEDYSVLNGTFAVENETETDPMKRTFKYSSYYLYYYPDPDGMNGGSAWCISQNKSYGGYNAWLYYNTESELASGTINWSSMMSSATSTAAVTTTNYPEVAFVLKGQKATAYDTASKLWTFAEGVSSFASTERTPVISGVFAATGTALIGNRIATAAGAIPADAIFYAPLTADVATAETGQTLTKNGTVTYADGVMSQSGNGRLQFSTAGLPQGSAPVTLSAWAKGFKTDQQKQWIFGYGGQESGTSVVMYAIAINSSGQPCIIYSSDRANGAHLAGPVPLTDGAWHHFCATYDGSTSRLYIDGELANSHAFTTSTGNKLGSIAGEYWDANSYGQFRAMRIYDRALDDGEVLALYAEF